MAQTICIFKPNCKTQLSLNAVASHVYNPNYFNMLRPQIDFDANHIEIVPNAYNLNTCN